MKRNQEEGERRKRRREKDGRKEYVVRDIEREKEGRHERNCRKEKACGEIFRQMEIISGKVGTGK